MSESKIIVNINLQAEAKVADLSYWREVRWEGGRLLYETTKIVNEIQNFTIEQQIIYLEKLLDTDFIIQDNLPNEAPDITLNFKNWLVKTISQLKIKSIQSITDLNLTISADIDLNGLSFDQIITDTLSSRIEEIIKGIKAETPLSIIFLSGGTLEGILVGKAKIFPKRFNETKCSPKQVNGKVKKLSEWTLNDLIDSSFEMGLINRDVKNFNHYLRDFRNYIHPLEQIHAGFNPTMDTAMICWQVLQMAIRQIKENGNKLVEKACA